MIPAFRAAYSSMACWSGAERDFRRPRGGVETSPVDGAVIRSMGRKQCGYGLDENLL